MSSRSELGYGCFDQYNIAEEVLYDFQDQVIQDTVGSVLFDGILSLAALVL